MTKTRGFPSLSTVRLQYVRALANAVCWFSSLTLVETVASQQAGGRVDTGHDYHFLQAHSHTHTHRVLRAKVGLGFNKLQASALQLEGIF